MHGNELPTIDPVPFVDLDKRARIRRLAVIQDADRPGAGGRRECISRSLGGPYRQMRRSGSGILEPLQLFGLCPR